MGKGIIIGSRAQLIRNGGTARNKAARRLALDAFDGALRAIDPYECLLKKARVTDGRISCGGTSVSLSGVRRVLVLAVGKAAPPMMKAALKLLKGYRVNGILVAPKGKGLVAFDGRIEVFQSSHPVPDINGLKASQSVKHAISTMGRDELLLCLISGGASAMLPAPAAGISLQDKKRVTGLLVKSRATIHEINTVRRHISSLKGGELVRLSRASKVLSLIISDVPGNNLPDIGSGLTVGDPTTFKDAVEILRKHGLWRKIPKSITSRLKAGMRGQAPQTPKPSDPIFRKVKNVIIADNATACQALKRTLEAKGIHTNILTTAAETEARNMGRLMASIASANKLHKESAGKAGAIIIGGETTVDVKGKGLGGRNQETVLSAIKGIEGLEGTVIASLGTDGIDGNSKAAGALADGLSGRRANRKGMDPQNFLRKNDSYRFFRKLNDNLVTGPTGTNVGDVYLLVSHHLAALGEFAADFKSGKESIYQT